MAKLTPDATRTEYGLVINQKIIPWGAVWPKDSGKYKKGQKYKADRRLSGGTGKVAGVTIHNTGDLPNVEEDAEQYSKTDDLQGNILDMYDALGSGTGVATEMANAINETEPERFERLTQRIQNVKESIGNSLLPTVNDLMSAGETVLTKVGSWIEENQELVRVIMLVVLAIGGFLTIAGTVAAVVGGVGLVITKAVSAFKILKAGFGIARAALSPLIGSVWSFTAALLANPVTWVVIGIAALIAAIVLLYNKCEWFRNLVNNIFNFFREKLGAAFETAKAIFSGIGNVIGSVMGAARDTVAEKLDNTATSRRLFGR